MTNYEDDVYRIFGLELIYPQLMALFMMLALITLYILYRTGIL